MNRHQKKQFLCYTIIGLNSFATTIYFTYVYFLLHDKFGFSDKANLAVAALLGLIYAFSAWQGGKFGQRYGNIFSVKLGFTLMGTAFAIGPMLDTAVGQIVVAMVVSASVCLTWPMLEALVTEGEAPARVPHAVGLYNVTWAATNALALFVGGALIEKLGYASLFWVPLIFMVVQLAMMFYLQRIYQPAAQTESTPAPESHRAPPADAKKFQQLAWLANPFAYIAINTLVAVLPGIAVKFHLTPMFAGFACSLWGFMRLAAFVLFWRWDGWHYRFRWLVTAFALIIASFAAILITPNLPTVLVAQFFFGTAIGLIYYSSLFYAMDASEAKSEHGGIHEATVGIGNCIGPAVGAVSLQLLPQTANAGALAVTGLLLCGLGGLLILRRVSG